MLIAGGGEVALAKARSLLSCGPILTAVAPRFDEAFQALAEQKALSLIARPFAESDLEGQTLVIAATNDSALNHAVVESARRRGILANAVDDPGHCDFFAGAVVRRGPLTLAIGTEGRFPGLTRTLREAFERWLPASLGEAADTLSGLREAARKAPLDPARRTEAINSLRSWFAREYLSPQENHTP